MIAQGGARINPLLLLQSPRGLPEARPEAVAGAKMGRSGARAV